MCAVDSSFRLNQHRLVTDPEDTALESCILINDSCVTRHLWLFRSPSPKPLARGLPGKAYTEKISVFNGQIVNPLPFTSKFDLSSTTLNFWWKSLGSPVEKCPFLYFSQMQTNVIFQI